MHRFIIICLSVLPVLCFPFVADAEIHDTGEIAGRIDVLFEKWNSLDTPGVAALVQLHGKSIYKKCYGMASLEHRVPITPETSFDLASVSKHITAFAILLLEKEGGIKLDDDIRDYLPELPEHREGIVINDLLYQSSGLWEFWSILNKYSGFRSRDYFTMNEVLDLVSHQKKLNFEPGTRYEYTNTNYSLLSEVVKRCAGVSFGEWVEKNITSPLGMSKTVIQEDCSKLIANKATAYRKRNGELVLARPSNVEIPGSAHAFTTLDDMAKWIDNFRTKEVGGEDIFQKMWTRGVMKNGERISYAAGLIVKDHTGTRLVEHSGQTGGYKTMLVYAPDEELGIVILANERSINVYGLSRSILDICLGNDDEGASQSKRDGEREFMELDVSVLDEYAGGYEIDESGGLIGVYRDGKNLAVNALGLGSDYFYPVSESEFVNYHGNVKITFESHETGEVAGAVVDLNGEIKSARKLDPRIDMPETIIELSGDYFCDALGITCEVRGKSGLLYLSSRRYDDVRLFCADRNKFVSSWGFMSFTGNGEGDVTGFDLSDEMFGYNDIRFKKICE